MTPHDSPRPEVVCPWCRGPLRDRGDGAHTCPACQRTFPEVAGILDLRTTSDRYLSLQDDRTKAERMLATGPTTLLDAVRAYWAMTPEVPVERAERYAARAAEGEPRGEALLATTPPLAPSSTLLDIGCGTGGLVQSAARAGAVVTGVDIAMRWLVIAAVGLRESGLTARLIAADGGALPFRAGVFDRVVCLETLEHAEHQQALVQSALAATRPGGRLDLVVANRLSLAPEPVAGLWGVGLLPRSVAPRYVAWRRHTRYQWFRAVSASDLRALVGDRNDVTIGPAPLPAPGPHASAARRAAQSAYDVMRATAVARPLLTTVGPYLQVTASPVPRLVGADRLGGPAGDGDVQRQGGDDA